jgi:hypothetical protein
MSEPSLRERLLAQLETRLTGAGLPIKRAPIPVIPATTLRLMLIAPDAESVRDASNGVATRELTVKFTAFARGDTGYLVCDDLIANLHALLMAGLQNVIVEELGTDFDEDEAEESAWRIVVRYRFIYQTSGRDIRDPAD